MASQDPQTRAEAPEAREISVTGSLPEIGLWWLRRRSLSLLAYPVAQFVFWVWAWFQGFAGWRVAAGLLVQSLLPLLLAIVQRRHVSVIWADTALMGAYFATALSGGLESPWLLMCVGSGFSYLLQVGWKARARVRLLGYLLAVAALGFAPSAWVGPRLPSPGYQVWAFVVLVLALAMNADNLSFLLGCLDNANAVVLRTRGELASQALRRASELELLSSRLSHELKNPLCSVKALNETLLRSAEDDRTRRLLDVIRGELLRMEGIIHEYLTFSRPLRARRSEPVQLGEVAENALRSLAGQALDAGVTLVVQGEAEILGDRDRLQEALINLAANAIQATPRGGRVALAVDADEREVRLVVSDTGAGMSPETLAKVGTAFFTTRDSGTGLGVLVARQVFGEHGGTLLYESTAGKGTTVVGRIPRPGAAAKAADAPARPGRV